MGSIADKLIYLARTKYRLKDVINHKGGKIKSNTTFRDYADIIKNLDVREKTKGVAYIGTTLNSIYPIKKIVVRGAGTLTQAVNLDFIPTYNDYIAWSHIRTLINDYESFFGTISISSTCIPINKITYTPISSSSAPKINAYICYYINSDQGKYSYYILDEDKKPIRPKLGVDYTIEIGKPFIMHGYDFERGDFYKVTNKYWGEFEITPEFLSCSNISIEEYYTEDDNVSLQVSARDGIEEMYYLEAEKEIITISVIPETFNTFVMGLEYLYTKDGTLGNVDKIYMNLGKMAQIDDTKFTWE